MKPSQRRPTPVPLLFLFALFLFSFLVENEIRRIQQGVFYCLLISKDKNRIAWLQLNISDYYSEREHRYQKKVH